MNLVDVAAERALLSTLCKFGSDGYNDISDIVTCNSFANEVNQVFYKCIEHHVKDHSNAKIDIPTIYSAANSLGLSHIINTDDSKKMLRAIINLEVDNSNVRKIAAKVRKLQIARDLGSVLDEAKANLMNVTGDETVSNIISVAENPVFEYRLQISESKNDGPELMSNDLKKYLEFLKNNPVKQVGLSTGFPLHDIAIGGGLRKKSVNVIAARAKQGKTSIANKVCIHVAKELGIPVLNLDTEMNKEDQLHRMIASLSGVDINDIATGKFGSDGNKDRLINETAEKILSIPYYYQSIAGLPFEDILSIMKRWVMKTVGLQKNGQAKDCLIVYDYLKLMDSANLTKNTQEYQELGFMMTGLQNFMNRYGVPCQTFVQLNRDGLDKENEAAISGSDRISWFCSSISLFKPKSSEEIAEDYKQGIKEKYNRKMIPLLARYGPGLDYGDYINLQFQGNICKISEGPTRNEIYSEDIVDKNRGSFGDDEGAIF